MQDAKTAKTPMSDRALVPNENEATPKEAKVYQETVGSIMFAMLETRPDIAFATSIVSRFAQNPSRAHIKAVNDILRYLSGSRTQGITYGGGDLKIIGYSNKEDLGSHKHR